MYKRGRVWKKDGEDSFKKCGGDVFRMEWVTQLGKKFAPFRRATIRARTGDSSAV